MSRQSYFMMIIATALMLTVSFQLPVDPDNSQSLNDLENQDQIDADIADAIPPLSDAECDPPVPGLTYGACRDAAEEFANRFNFPEMWLTHEMPGMVDEIVCPNSTSSRGCLLTMDYDQPIYVRPSPKIMTENVRHEFRGLAKKCVGDRGQNGGGGKLTVPMTSYWSDWKLILTVGPDRVGNSTSAGNSGTSVGLMNGIQIS